MNIFSFDIPTLVGMLFWGNLTCLVLVAAFVFTNEDVGDRILAWHLIAAKLLLSAAFLLISYRGHIPNLLSINVGNTLMMAGGFVEARSLLLLMNEKDLRVMRLTLAIAVVSILVLNLTTAVVPGVYMRITAGTIGIFLILIVPVSKLVFSSGSSPFKRIVGLFYLLFIVMQLPRGLYYIGHPEITAFSNSPIQVISYTSLLLLTFFSLSAFLLLMKEQADERMRQMATTDFLTGLYNRQNFFRLVKIPFERHQRKEEPCGVMFLDVDHFKRVNDTMGHAFGDEVLKSAASILREVVRGYDISCRFGGEEFAVFIDSSDPDAIRGVAERIRARIENLTFAGHSGFKITISIGLAIGRPLNHDTIDRFLNEADEALYEAKESGRNRVVERIVNA